MKKVLSVVLIWSMLCIPCRASESVRIYGDSQFVSHAQQDKIYDCLERPEYRWMLREIKGIVFLVVGIIEQESGGNGSAVSATNDYGLCQINITANQDRIYKLGVTNLLDEDQSILVCVDILNDHFKNYYESWMPDYGNVLMHYNGTPNATEKYKRGEYSDYAKKILARFDEMYREASVREKIESKKNETMEIFARIPKSFSSGNRIDRESCRKYCRAFEKDLAVRWCVE